MVADGARLGQRGAYLQREPELQGPHAANALKNVFCLRRPPMEKPAKQG